MPADDIKKNSNIKRHYFDWAASSIFDSSAEMNADCFACFANPSSQHSEGKEAKNALENARARCAKVLNVPPETLFFTSGGTESNSIALFSNLTRKSQGTVISSEAEHPSVREAVETLAKMGRPVGTIAVDSSGCVTAAALQNALLKNPDARFASVMAVNNETGSVTDIACLADVIRKHREISKAPVHFHCDLVQAAGKIPVRIADWEIDSASISAHKISGPRGIGLLYLRKPFRQEIFYSGGGQENGVRGGTENVCGAVSLAGCLEKYAVSANAGFAEGEPPENTVERRYARAKARWKKLIGSLKEIKRCAIIPKERLADDDRFSPYILQAAFNDIPGEVMARALDDLGFAVSTGSACSSSSPERPVLLAMGVEEKLRIEGIRISQGYTTTDEQIDLLLDAVTEVLKFL
ncbi:MAG: aminotransferase class V-fold PLP-dependent enzyme [Treponema sp.]|jgi:cysteine desulfurase|nr:aminotransferase class V-fold PLP-dependent enzyme [Treponema sp.]